MLLFKKIPAIIFEKISSIFLTIATCISRVGCGMSEVAQKQKAYDEATRKLEEAQREIERIERELY